jgi:uncharacterized protein YndB with AHSA1/START domain
MAATRITVETTVAAKPSIAWERWTDPSHITKWTFASPDWHAPRATNDLRTGGSFSTRMEAKDGSFGFDYGGDYLLVGPLERLEMRLGDGRLVEVSFVAEGTGTRIVETFDAEGQNPAERQRAGWQAILDNFRRYVESG